MYTQLKFETPRFNPYSLERRFDKDIRPGGDVAMWLCEHLQASNYQDAASRMAGDELWVVEASDGGQGYLIGIRMVPGHGRTQELASNKAVWCMLVEKKRSVADRLLFRNRLAKNDSFCHTIFELLERQFDFTNVSKNRCFLGP